ncbi:MAG: hypothetical protein WAqPseu_41010 [Shewanella algae]
MQLILLKQVTERTGLGGSSIYSYMAAGYFPRSVKLGPTLVVYAARACTGELPAI